MEQAEGEEGEEQRAPSAGAAALTRAQAREARTVQLSRPVRAVRRSKPSPEAGAASSYGGSNDLGSLPWGDDVRDAPRVEDQDVHDPGGPPRRGGGPLRLVSRARMGNFEVGPGLILLTSTGRTPAEVRAEEERPTSTAMVIWMCF